VSGVPVIPKEVNEAGQLLQDRRFIQTVPVAELEVGLNPRSRRTVEPRSTHM
jgi:hypothetical protein